LLRAHLPGVTDASLNQAAVQGLLTELAGRTELIDNSAAAPTNGDLVKVTALDKGVVWLQVRRVTDNLAASLRSANQAATATNKVTGTVLDLRFTPGDAYGGAKEAAAALVPGKTPLVVLVNGSTSGAAELLAADLREGGALILGSPTAGLAMTMTDFPLANGDHLLVATTPIKFHDTTMTRVEPDILVKVDPAAERAFINKPYASVEPPDTIDGTNGFAALLDHTSEAELVREKRKDGDGSGNPEPPAHSEPSKPFVRDPVLARAVDLVEGLAVVRESHL